MKKKVLIVLKIIFFILMIGSLIGLISWKNDKKEIESILEETNTMIKKEEINGEVVYSYSDQYEFYNDDTVAWLIVPNTNINYPVVQSDNNEYYLNHNYKKKKNSAGWVFLDKDNNLLSDDQNIVIYGHHRKDGIMFGDVDKLMKKKYYDENDGTIILVYADRNDYYKIFSVYSVDSDDFYTTKNFKDFDDTIKEFEKRSEIDFNRDLKNVEQILTLSTCHNNNKDRLIVQAYKIN